MQADSAALHEGVDNALKLVGDDYLARLYGIPGSGRADPGSASSRRTPRRRRLT